MPILSEPDRPKAIPICFRTCLPLAMALEGFYDGRREGKICPSPAQHRRRRSRPVSSRLSGLRYGTSTRTTNTISAVSTR